MKIIRDFFPEFANAQVIHDFFGKWPTLHDAEVIELVLNRELGFDFAGPKLSMTLFGCSDCPANAPTTPTHCKIVLHFGGVELDYVEDFNHQNAMADFMMEKYYCDRLRQDMYRVEFGEFGAKVRFSCKTVTVVSVEPFEPTDYFKKRDEIEQAL